MDDEKLGKTTETNGETNRAGEAAKGAAAQAEAIVAEAAGDAKKYTFWQLLRLSKKKGKALGLSKKTLILLDIKEWVAAIVFAVAAVALLVNFGVRIITVDGTSMNPTLEDGERLFVTAFDVRFGSSPEKGDVVICHYPGRTTKWLGIFTVRTDFVKRVMGVPGDEIKRVRGVTYINGEAILPEYKTGYQATYEIAENGTITYYLNGMEMVLADEDTYSYSFDYEYTLGDDEYFVVGDNRERYGSHDSRTWNGPDLPFNSVNNASGHVGPITKSMIAGRVRSVVMPFGKARSVPNDAQYMMYTITEGENEVE